MASPNESWNAAAICQALCCPGCPDCREDDGDATWDGKDDGHSWVCEDPFCPNQTAYTAPGDCPDCTWQLIEIGPDGHEVTP
jgi:hypothetical protein